MPKLYSSDYIIKILIRRGFVFISQKGSHKKYRKTGITILTVIVSAGRKEIPFVHLNPF
ncbi:MAG: type II toxin-antitoxin system HicA family toxin [Ginsengibacter sp.]